MAPKTRKITFSQEQIFFFHQDLLVLILVSYWKSQFFPLPSIDMGCITCFTSPNKSFINSLANRRLPCKSEKMNYKFKKKTCIGQANLVLLCLWLQKIDLSGGFPCMLLVVFSILRIWHFLVVFFCIPHFLFTIKEVLLQNPCKLFDTGAVFSQCVPPLNSAWVYIIRSTNENRVLERSPCIWTLTPPLQNRTCPLALFLLFSPWIIQQPPRSFGV